MPKLEPEPDSGILENIDPPTEIIHLRTERPPVDTNVYISVTDAIHKLNDEIRRMLDGAENL